MLAGSSQVDGDGGRDEGGERGGGAAPQARRQRPLARSGQRQGQRRRPPQRRLRLGEHQQAQQQAGDGAARVRRPADARTRVAQQKVVVQRKRNVRQTQHAHGERALQPVLERREILQQNVKHENVKVRIIYTTKAR